MKNILPLIFSYCFSIIATGCAQTSSLATRDTEMRSGIILHEGCSFGITPPRGWVLDTESGAGNGVPAVFYPEGSSWADSRTVMYTNVTAKDSGQTGAALIEYDVTRFTSDDPEVVITDLPSRTVGRKTVTVKSFLGKSPENYEAVAYIDEKDHVVFLVLSARDRSTFESSLPSFSELVDSYVFMGAQGR